MAALLATGVGAQHPPPATERWHRASAPDLEVAGAVAPRRLDAIARDLGRVRAGVLELAGAPDHRAPYPTTVVVFHDRGALAAYHREADGSAPASPILTAADRRGRLIALALDSLEHDLPHARRALASDLVEQLFATPPRWIAAGLPRLAQRLEPAADGSGRLIERLPSSGRDARSTHRRAPEERRGATGRGAEPDGSWPPLDAFLSATLPDEVLREAAVDLVRHLANPRSERSSQLRRYLTLLRAGLPDAAAFEECFFQPFASVYADVGEAVARGGAPPIELAPSVPETPVATVLHHPDVLLLLGDLIARTAPWNTVAAELHYRDLLAIEPDDAGALRGIALLRELDGRPEDALPYWERSLAADPHDPTTRLLFGWSRLERFRRAVGTRRGWEEPLPGEVAAARELFRDAPGAATGAPAPPPAPGGRAAAPAGRWSTGPSPHRLHGFGATFLFAAAGFEPGLDALQQASDLLPGDHRIAADRALLLAHAGDPAAAWELWRPRRDLAPAALDVELEKLLVEEALHHADRLLLVDEDPDAARGLLRTALEETRNPTTRTELEALSVQLERVAAQIELDRLLDRFLHAYEEAQRLAAERRFDEARRLLEPFAADDLDPIVRDPARDVLRQLDEADSEAP